jgi:hypothetical protein
VEAHNRLTDGGEVSLTRRPSFTPHLLVLISVRGWVDFRVIVRLERLGQLKSPVTHIGNGTRDLLACIVLCMYHGINITVYSMIRFIAFLVMKPCGLVNGYGRFEETCRFFSPNALYPYCLLSAWLTLLPWRYRAQLPNLCNLKCYGTATFFLCEGIGGGIILLRCQQMAQMGCISPNGGVVADMRVQIRSERLLDTSLEWYGYFSPIGIDNDFLTPPKLAQDKNPAFCMCRHISFKLLSYIDNYTCNLL